MVHSYHSQISDIFKVEGKKDLYIAMADRWVPERMHRRYEVYGKLYERYYIEKDTSAYDELKENAEVHSTQLADYVWLPFRFDGEMAYLDWHDEWRIEDYE